MAARPVVVVALATMALWRYDPAGDRWTRLPDAPTARGALVAGVIGDRLYVAGGARSAEALATLEIYDISSRRWSTGPSMAVAREHLAGAVLGGSFYAIAGRTAGRGNLRVVERYVPARRRWKRMPSMRRARGGIAAASVKGRIVVVGGEQPRARSRRSVVGSAHAPLALRTAPADPAPRPWRRLL